MSAPALAVNWEAVEAHAVTHGVREAARAFALNENTVMARARRYGWIARIREAQAHAPALPASMLPKEPARIARTAPEAALSQKEKYGNQSKTSLLRAAVRGSRHIANRSGKQIVEKYTLPMLQMASAVAKLCPEQTTSGPLVSIQLLTAPLVEHTGTTPVKAVEHAPMLDLPE